MNEIVECVNRLRKKLEYKFYHQIKRLEYIDADDIANDIIVKLIQKHNEGTLDLNDIDNYAFIAYRNYIWELNRRHKYRDEIDTETLLYEDNSYEELYPTTDPKLLVIEKILGPLSTNELLKYYEYKIEKNKELKNTILNPFTQKKFTECDKKRYIRWRRRVLMNYNKFI